MNAKALIIWLIVGAVAGWLAGMVVKGGACGLIGNIIVGIVGGLIAGWLLPFREFVRTATAAQLNGAIGFVCAHVRDRSKLLSKDEARQIAANIAKLPELAR